MEFGRVGGGTGRDRYSGNPKRLKLGAIYKTEVLIY